MVKSSSGIGEGGVQPSPLFISYNIFRLASVEMEDQKVVSNNLEVK